MSMELQVYALSEHLCTVKCELDWTGQQLKEAIEEATNYKELVGSQQLAVGTSFLSDSDLLKDVDGLHVSLTRRAHPRVRQLPEENLEPLALSLRRFAKSPVLVWVITKGYVFNGNPDMWDETEQVLKKINREYVEEMDWDQCEDELLHRHLNSEMMDDMVPWQAICGISPDDIAAVLALQACYMWIGDGNSSVAALLLLKDNTLVSVFANVKEAVRACEFGDATVASIETGKTWEELQSKLPHEFVQALVKPISEWTFGPHRMTGEDLRKAPPAFAPYSSLRVAVMQLITQTHDYHWTCGDVLRKRGIDMGHCSAFEGLWFCPTRPLCWRIWHHRLMFALNSCAGLTETWRSAAQEATKEMTRDGLNFSEALDFFQWRFAVSLDREMWETGATTTDAKDLRILREVQRRFNEKIQEIQLKIHEFVESGKNLDGPIDAWLESFIGLGQEIDGVWHEPEMRLFVELILDGQTVVDTDRWLEKISSEVADESSKR